MHERQLASRAADRAAVLFLFSLARFFFLPRLGLQANSILVAELIRKITHGLNVFD